ncbi:cytochrome oxidase maturation protein, cbb3-type, partial [Cupriavidus sp. YR651]
MSTITILLSAFVLSMIGLFAFIWTQRRGLFDRDPKAAEVIFAPGEIGSVEDPAND